ncbi:iron transporter [Romboutsia ilealis]|uniref:NEAT domain-containing protein n=1 Tax=Romboutsia faecis TaxID=2764597 RepID=A0ABR7JKV4_9FIRM|nr:NEAT domain-containing protein [Romboutsia faecis]MBC5995554.1 NEAT domain-containing protein [Romboutsia faecis]MRN23754.1 iron transporter [Romboutsia ilealis]
MKSFKNKLFSKVSTVFSLILIGALSLSSNIVHADNKDEISSGIYTLKNDTNYEDGSEIGMSMSRSYTDEDMTLEKRDGKIYYTLGLSGAQYMNNHRVLVNDESVKYEKVEENTEEGTIKLKFEVSDPKDKIVIQMYVDAMGRDVEYELIPKLDTIELVEAIEEEPKVEETSVESDKTDSQVKDASEKTSINIPLIGGVVILAIAVIFFMVKKKK